MTDIRTVIVDMAKGANYLLEESLLAQDDGFDTAILISLFTDRQADAADTLPQGQTDRRGWWADAYATTENGKSDPIGSRLWLLDGKRTQANLIKAREYAEEALAWMVTDGIARRIEAAAHYLRDNILAITLTITRQTGEVARRRFEIMWSAV
ncbi:MAG: hypothetical protein C4516_04390 [Oxalobacter sp.]|nr:MAG: hypothetical protein C4516_04390 [Oxalobacter sp.]